MRTYFGGGKARTWGLGAMILLALAWIAAGLPLRGQATGSAPATSPTATAKGVGTAPAETAPDEPLPHMVYVGVYINQIKSVDLKNNEYVVDFWVWFRWKGDIKPTETFEVVNGHIESKEGQPPHEVKGFHYADYRVTATVTNHFNITRFPLDAHTLTLDIEDSDADTKKLVYQADTTNTGLSPDLLVPGWRVKGTRTQVMEHTYASNYGDISLDTGDESVYSRFSYQMDLERPGLGYFFKLFWSLFLATVIALLSLLIDPVDLDPRFGLGVGAIFAAIASSYVISASLPESNQFTLADKMNMLAVAVIFATIFQSVFSLRLWKSGKETASKELDKICFWGMLVLYVAGCAVMVIV